MTPVNRNIFIALGSNIGDREGNLLRGVAETAKLPGSRITALSSFYDTEPVGMAVAENFLNAVLRLESRLAADELLHELMRIETVVFHRTRGAENGPRRMDLDILFYGDTVINSPPDLMIPHPRLHERRFVLEPLVEIAPDFKHPVMGTTLRQLLAGLSVNSRVTRV